MSFLAGGGEMGYRVRAYDWDAHPLGSPDGWPSSLRMALRLLYTTQHPMFIFWGAEYYCFYNDAYARSIGPEKHAVMLGAPGAQMWTEIWDVVSPQLDFVMRGEGATWHENQLIPIWRYGRRDNVYWTYGYSPIHDDDAPTGVGGVLVVCTETTSQMRAEQRQRFLVGIDDALRPIGDARDIVKTAIDALGRELGASRIGYGEVQADQKTIRLESNYTHGVAPLLGNFSLDGFGPHNIARHREGETVVWNDVATDPANVLPTWESIDTRAVVSVPLVRDGRFRASLFVNDRLARDWSFDEIRLIEAVAARIWDAVERARAEAALRDAVRRKDLFLATLSHELRNPLAPIRTAADLLASSRLNAAQLQWVQSAIQRQVKHMAALLDDLLDVARVTQGKLELKRELIPLAGVVDAAVEAAAPLLDAKHHGLIVKLPPETLTVEADPVRLAQVIGNLLTNAGKYTNPGGEITVSAWAEGMTLVLSVKDTGVGIRPDSLERIFEMFSQVEETIARSEGGLGIGLALVRGIVTLHDGQIEARSDGLGRGSEFIVRLPLAASLPPAEPEVAPLPSPARGFRVLIADDNRDAADSLALLLKLSGHEVRVAYGGREALAMVREHGPQFVLLDIGMPDLDGYQVAERLRGDPLTQWVTLIALTGWGQEEDRNRAQAAGFDHHLTKPIDPQEIEQLFRSSGETDASPLRSRSHHPDG
jgi:signal transduction histidine kinase/ActR/RegA family two-component response regulator